MRRHHYKPYLGGHGAMTPPVPTTNGITARYERFSHSGNTWYDLTPTPANGTDTGTPGFWPVFDGVSGVSLGQPTKLDFTGAFTCSFWSKQSAAAPPGSERMIARDDGGPNRSWVVVSVDPGGAIASYFWGVGFPAPGYTTVTTPANPLGVWYYTTFVNEGPGNDIVNFVDGVERARNVGGGGVVVPHPVNTEIGQDSAAASKFQGDLDTVRLYTRALSADEILRDYKAGKPVH